MLNILFPRICNGCSNILSASENILCTHCRHSLPLICHHRNEDTGMKDVFYGRFSVENATAMLQFNKRGIAQQILHNLKYRGQEDISAFFGQWLGQELYNHPQYQSIDMVIPVPLHKQKMKTRGYNQVAGFGKEIAKALKIEYRDDILLKISKTSSQVFKPRFLRVQDDAIFTLSKPNEVINKHILLVDDIVTTGATLENCAQQFLKNEGCKLSLATMAIA